MEEPLFLVFLFLLAYYFRCHIRDSRNKTRDLATVSTFMYLISFGLTATLANTPAPNLAQKNRIELTKDEKAFLKAHPVITFGTDETWAPYVIKNSDGTLKGFDVDMLKYINESTGSNIQLIAGQWQNIIKKAKNHEIDGLSTSASLKERESDFKFSNKYTSDFPLVIIKSKSQLRIDQLADLSEKSIALQKGNAFHKALLNNYPDIKAIEVDTQIKALTMVVEGKVDAAFASTTTYNTIHKMFLNTLKIGYVISEKPLDVVYSIRKDWPELVSIINKSLAAFPRETQNSIYSHWFGFNINGMRLANNEKRIELTADEKEWIRKHPIIRIGVDPVFQPIEFIDKKGRHQGVSSDYVQILNRRLGLNMKVIPNLTWVQIMQTASRRGIDVLPAIAKTAEREKYLSYTKPYIYIDWIIVSRIETPRIKGLSELKGRITAVNKGYSSQLRIEKEHPDIPLVQKNTALDILRSVIEGKAEAAVIERYSATAIIQSYRMHTLKVDAHVLQKDDPIAFAVRNDWPELVQIINKGLTSISQEERDIIHQKWKAMPIQIGFTIKDVQSIILSVVTVMGLFLMGSIFWNRRLKKEVDIRIKTEKALEDSNSLMKIGELIANLGFFEHNWQTGSEVWSDGLCKLLGVEKQEIQTPRDFTDFVHNNDRTRVNKHIQETLKNKTNMDIEFQLIQKNGKTIDIHGMGVNSYDGDGNFLITRGTFQDISERKQAEDTLMKCLDTTASSIGITSIVDGTFLYLNNRFAEMLGWEKSEMIGKKSQDFDMFYDVDKKNILYEKLQSEQMFRNEEIIYKHKSGRLIHGLLSATIIDSERLAFSIYDITERKQSETTRLKLEQQIQQSQKLESIGTLAGGIAHDFNNMLGIVFGNISYLLTQFNEHKELVEVLSEVMEQAKNAQNLTQQLLTFSKGGAPVKKASDLNSLIDEAAKFVTRGANTRCEFNLANDLWITEVDPGQFNQVISNVIINSNQAMPEGGIIRISTENKEIEDGNIKTLPPGRYTKITIKDQGVGIAEKHVLKIFDPYFSTKHTGSGLGLATTFSIIKRHGGHISVSSEIDKGTSFQIYLPASSREFEKTAKSKKSKHTGKGSILIMDDEEQILVMATRMLNRMGYETEVSKDGDEAVKKYHEAFKADRIFDLVILDLTIPGGMGGAKTIKKLLKIHPNVKAVVSSGYSNDPIMANHKDYGFCGVVPKPYSLSQLAEVLNNIIPKRD